MLKWFEDEKISEVGMTLVGLHNGCEGNKENGGNQGGWK